MPRRHRRGRRERAGHAALRTGALDVLAQHMLGRACGAPFFADELYAEVRAAAPYAALARADFDAALDFVATGGYALKAYERFAKIRLGKDGRWRITHPRVAQRYRMNVGTIVEADMLKVRLVRSRAAAAMIPRGGRLLGQVEEYFIETLAAGRHLRVRRRDSEIRGAGRGRGLCLAFDRDRSEGAGLRRRQVSALDLSRRARARDPRRPAAPGSALPDQVREWLEIQQWRSLLPARRRPAGRDLPARGQILSGLLSVRGPAGASDARHAADAAARARAAASRWASSPTNMRWRSGGWATSRCASRAASCRSRSCSTRTCWATISKPGSPNPR